MACEHGGRRISRTQPDGSVVTVVDKFQGKRFNSPNDLVFARDGSLYFTDPSYGLELGHAKGPKELDWKGLYRLSPTGEVALVAKEFAQPNGVALSPDQKTLYVADTPAMRVHAFPVRPDGSVGEGRIFAERRAWAPDLAGQPDGVKVDERGNVYTTGPGGVWVFSAQGKRLGVIATPEGAANIAFGGDDYKTLYITASTGLYRIRMKVRGSNVGGSPAAAKPKAAARAESR